MRMIQHLNASLLKGTHDASTPNDIYAINGF